MTTTAYALYDTPPPIVGADYDAFLLGKSQSHAGSGIKASWLPDFLFNFQGALIDWSLWTGRSALFEDCGLGKTIQELVWAENVVRHTGGNVLIAAPLAVSHQIVREAEKFGIRATRSADGTAYPGITVTNYERLHLFNPADFIGFVGDESSILKSFSGTMRQRITIFMRHIPFRLLSTATPAPNDYTEIGTTSEALGYLGHVDMLTRFFVNDKGNISQGRSHGKKARWRFKGHAEMQFWRWVCSFARAVRKPSDLGFDDGPYILPELIERTHTVAFDTPADGCLFSMPAATEDERREEIRKSIRERCERVAELVNPTGQPAFIGCHLNEEGDLLESLIPDAIQVSGSDSDEVKEARLLAFANGDERVLITKDRIGAWGLNLQHCNHVVRFPSHSYEAYYQFVRRCWRFGQQRPVTVDIVTTDGCRAIVDNMLGKADAASSMFSHITAQMNAAQAVARAVEFTETEELPKWLYAVN